jgi:hypothetical protein
VDAGEDLHWGGAIRGSAAILSSSGLLRRSSCWCAHKHFPRYRCALTHTSTHASLSFTGLDPWRLAVAEQLAASSKSVLLGLATAAGRLSVQESLAAARLEEDMQIEEWGMVEGGHDIDVADARVRIAAPSLFVRLLDHAG